MSIARRIVIAVLGGLLPLIVGLATAAAEMRSTVRQEVLAGLDRIADVQQAGIRQSLNVALQRLDGLRDGRGVIGRLLSTPHATEAQLIGALDAALAEQPGLESITLYGLDGSLLGQGYRPGDTPPLPVDPDDLRQGTVAPRWTTAYQDGDGTGRFQVVAPIVDGATPLAVLVVECELAPILAALSPPEGLGRTAEVNLLQRDAAGGAVFVSALRFDPGGAFNRTVDPGDEGTAAITAVQRGAGVAEGVRDYRNVEVVVAYRLIDDTPWVLMVKVDRAEAFARYARLTQTLVLVGAVIGLFLIVGLSLTARSIVRRLRGVTEAAEAISRGDLSRRIGGHGPDEFGRLACAFDEMADHLAADIQRRRHVELELQHRARHDDLTGLPGRVVAYDHLTRALSDASHPAVGVLFCDLDSFKTINDELGHSAGDALLQQVAQRLRAVAHPTETVARFGGDEFVVVCRALDDPGAVVEVAERVRGALATPFLLAGRSVVVTTSIGSVVVEPGASSDAESVLRDADAAMYRAKELGRNRHVALDDETRLRASVALSAVINLRRAIADGSLELRYQPVMDLQRGTVYGVEALLRRAAGVGVPGEPADLVALAAASGLSLDLDRWVFTTACRQLRAWLEAGCSGLCMSINLSAASLEEPALATFLLGTAAAQGVSPQRLCLELTEVAIHHDDRSIAVLQELRAAGFRIAIDDFGMGYSNLTRLRELPVDVLKVDRSFLLQLETDPAAVQICAAITQLGRALGLAVVAEGVERPSQVDVIARLGCRLAQGYLFAPALDPDELLAIVQPSRFGRPDVYAEPVVEPA